MIPTQFTNKELKDQELINIHKSLFTKLLNENDLPLWDKQIAIQFYDHKVTTENIRLIYNRHITIFAQALLTNRLETIYKNSTHSK